jgi:glycosyltransferase involved in cell wall biosynthesis
LNNKLTPTVSIVIPTYNRAKLISRALKSIIDQTFVNWEAIVVDSYSTDSTDEILKNFKDPRIKYVKIQNHDGIIAKSRNLGIKMAKGEWIAFLDSDDWWTNDKLKVCLNNIDDKVDFIYHELEIVDSKSKFLKKKNLSGRELKKPILNNLLEGVIKDGNAIGQSSVVVRKKLLVKIGGISEDKNLIASEDFHTWLRIAKITDNFKFLKKRLGFYLVHGASVQNRDLSIPHKQAVVDFMNLYNSHQKLNLEVKLNYMSANYNISIKNYTKAKKKFLFVIKNGSFNYKIRSIIKIIIMIFK